MIEGKSSVPQVAVGEDEFVELDEEGNPRRKSGKPDPHAARGGRPQEGSGASPAGGRAPGRCRCRCRGRGRGCGR